MKTVKRSCVDYVNSENTKAKKKRHCQTFGCERVVKAYLYHNTRCFKLYVLSVVNEINSMEIRKYKTDELS